MNKRDLKADREICNKATPGPWEAQPFVTDRQRRYEVFDATGQCVCTLVDAQSNAAFITQAREGWPRAIERAMRAETLVRELAEALEVTFRLLEDHQPNWYLRMHFNQINNALGNYKEVLGDK